MDDLKYLEPGWNPSSAKMAILRSILVAHAIPYPSSCRKQKLIDLFNEHIVPQAANLREFHGSAKRTSAGIEDFATGRIGTGASDDKRRGGMMKTGAREPNSAARPHPNKVTFAPTPTTQGSKMTQTSSELLDMPATAGTTTQTQAAPPSPQNKQSTAGLDGGDGDDWLEATDLDRPDDALAKDLEELAAWADLKSEGNSHESAQKLYSQVLAGIIKNGRFPFDHEELLR